MGKGSLRRIESERERRAAVLPQQLEQQRRETVQRGGGLPCTRGHVRERVVRSKEERERVEEKRRSGSHYFFGRVNATNPTTCVPLMSRMATGPRREARLRRGPQLATAEKWTRNSKIDAKLVRPWPRSCWPTRASPRCLCPVYRAAA